MSADGLAARIDQVLNLMSDTSPLQWFVRGVSNLKNSYEKQRRAGPMYGPTLKLRSSSASLGGDLFLGGHLLFDLAPGADLQPAADPTQGLSRHYRGLRAANRTFHRFGQTIRRNGAFGLLEDLGWNYGLGFWLRLAFHGRLPVAPFNMADVPPGNKRYAASGIRITAATSRAEAQRGHF
jgi:hypothetical protein